MENPKELPFTNEVEANTYIAADSLALLIGLVLHQQILTEKAFHSPLILRDRLGKELDATEIAAMDPEQLDAAFQEEPALHRFPGSMSKRVQSVCEHVTETYDGLVPHIWDGIEDADELMQRMVAIPGFAEYKA